MFKKFEVRLTIHQRYLSPPDYESAHQRMRAKGFSHVIMVAGQQFATLGGMYRRTTPFGTVQSVAKEVTDAFHQYAWEISFQVIEVAAELDHNLEPATPLAGGALAALLASARLVDNGGGRVRMSNHGRLHALRRNARRLPHIWKPSSYGKPSMTTGAGSDLDDRHRKSPPPMGNLHEQTILRFVRLSSNYRCKLKSSMLH